MCKCYHVLFNDRYLIIRAVVTVSSYLDTFFLHACMLLLRTSTVTTKIVTETRPYICCIQIFGYILFSVVLTLKYFISIYQLITSKIELSITMTITLYVARGWDRVD